MQKKQFKHIRISDYQIITNNFGICPEEFFFAIFCLQKPRDHTSVDEYPFFPAWITYSNKVFYVA